MNRSKMIPISVVQSLLYNAASDAMKKCCLGTDRKFAVISVSYELMQQRDYCAGFMQSTAY